MANYEQDYSAREFSSTKTSDADHASQIWNDAYKAPSSDALGKSTIADQLATSPDRNQINEQLFRDAYGSRSLNRQSDGSGAGRDVQSKMTEEGAEQARQEAVDALLKAVKNNDMKGVARALENALTGPSGDTMPIETVNERLRQEGSNLRVSKIPNTSDSKFPADHHYMLTGGKTLHKLHVHIDPDRLGIMY